MKKIASLDVVITLLKAVAEVSRLRILALLYHEDLTISDFTFILSQSQSRVSRHLRLLYEARLIECYQKGGWIYFKLCHSCLGKDIMMAAISALPKHDMILAYDCARLLAVKKKRRKMRQEYFLRTVTQWNTLRSSYVADHVVESALLEVIGDKLFETMLDIGIGTGSFLKLFSGLYTSAVKVALDSDVFLQLSFGDKTFDLVIFHWALLFLENPETAFNELARVLRPNGCLLVLDFVHYEVGSSHFYDADMHIGFSDSQIEQWLENTGLILEKKVFLSPMKTENNERLMAILWLARDPCLLIDDLKDKKVDFA
ncbi:ArsR/SmtB family transcription factor [Bartonella sp. CB169]|uniref:ArsR/SmtB family transcription factor n=1 Tax=Bartonella sp. CB169 TaxID=3112257 RepID=UPI00300E6A57